MGSMTDFEMHSLCLSGVSYFQNEYKVDLVLDTGKYGCFVDILIFFKLLI